MKSTLYILRQFALMGIVALVADTFICAVGFLAQMLRGNNTLSSSHFIGFMFVWIFALCFPLFSILAYAKIRQRVREAEITIDALARMSKSERTEFEKRFEKQNGSPSQRT